MQVAKGTELCGHCETENDFTHEIGKDPVITCKDCGETISVCDVCKGAHNEQPCPETCQNGSAFNVMPSYIEEVQ